MADTTATPVRLRAPVITLARTAAPILTVQRPINDRATSVERSFTTDTTDPEIIALHAMAENALSWALSALRDPAATAADLERATGRVIRAATAMKRLSAATQEGAAA